MRSSAGHLLVLVLVLPVFLTGCATVGPTSIRAGRTDYNEAIVRTSNEQLLLNIVRLRYRDTPFFLSVGSVTAQYSFGGSASLGAAKAEGGSAEASVGSGISYEESPTVSYAPLTGDRFVRQMLSPLPLEALWLLSESGWSIERILRCCVQRVNDVWNAPSASGPTPERAPEFEQFLAAAQALRELQQQLGLELGVRQAAPGDETVQFVLRLRPDVDPAATERMRRLLALPAEAVELPLTPSPAFRGPQELAVAPRSMMGVLFYLSHGVDVPETDVERGHVTKTVGRGGVPFEWSALTGDLLRIRSSSERPRGAFVAVPYRGSWFWIADDDLASKSTFGLVQQLFHLQAGEARLAAPVLTVPVS
jgi:hypothetical protein